MKKIFYFISVFSMCFAMLGCTETDMSVEHSTQESGYSIQIDGVQVVLGSTVEDVIEQILEVPSYFEAPSCAFVGTDYIYTYQNYTITYATMDDKIQLVSLTLTSDIVTTDEGAYIGQSIEDVISIYGQENQDDDASLVYTKGDSQLKFICSDSEVISIILQVNQ